MRYEIVTWYNWVYIRVLKSFREYGFLYHVILTVPRYVNFNKPSRHLEGIGVYLNVDLQLHIP